MNGDDLLAVIIPALRRVGAAIDPAQLERPTPCKDFDVAGVLGHMTDLASSFVPMFRGEAPPVGPPASSRADLLGRFEVAMGELLEAVQSPGALTRTMHTPGGAMPGDVFSRLVAFDGLIHGWDLATSTGQAWDLEDDVVAEVDGFARQALTDQMRDGDAWDTEKQPAPHATPIERLVAFSGRTALREDGSSAAG